MLLKELIRVVSQLSHQDKLRLMHFLIQAIAKEEKCSLEPYEKSDLEDVLLNHFASTEAVSSSGEKLIIRTEQGLTIKGTRLTLYDVMDYLIAEYPPKFIGAMLNLTHEQVNAVVSYIEANWAEVEAEYQIVLKQASEIHKYYEEENREVVEKIAKMPPPPGKEAAWEKLKAHKAKLESQT